MPPPTDAQVALIRRFEPILFFHAQERFFPSDAKRYLEQSALTVGAAPVIAAGKLAAIASEAGAPTDYLGRKLGSKAEFLEEPAASPANPGMKDAFLDLAGWMPPTPQLPEPKRYANLKAIADRYADAADPLNASQFWYHAEFFDKARLESLFADDVAKGGKSFGPLIETAEAEGAFKTPALICYYLFFPGHDEGLPGCEAVPSAKEFASFAGEWACFAVLLDGPGAGGPFIPRYVGLSMRNVGVADPLGDGNEVRVGMRIFPWEALRAQAQNEHPRLLVAQGSHSLYLPSETPGTVKAFTPDDPGRNSCGLAEPVAAAMEGTENITAPPFLLPPGEAVTNVVKILSAAAGGALIGLAFGPIGAAVGAIIGGVIVGGSWAGVETKPFQAGSSSSPAPSPTPGPVTDAVPPTAAGPTAGKVVHPVGTVPPEAAGGRGQPWRSEKLGLGNRKYDFTVDRDAQIFWAGDPALPGFPGRWGPPVEADPQPRRAGMRFPKFWRMFFRELVLAPPKFVTVALPLGKKTDGGDISAATATFTGFDFGPAAANRQIFAGVGMHGSGAPHLTAATIGGVAATIVFEALNLSPATGVYFIAANVPNGTSGDIVLTFDSAVTGVGVCTWIVSGAAVGAVSLSSDNDNSVPQTGFASCPDGGAIFGLQGIPSATAGATVWTGVTGNEHAQFSNGSNRWAAGVAQAFPLAQSGLAVSATPSNGSLSNPTTAWIGVAPV